jgi:hypothetical protein
MDLLLLTGPFGMAEYLVLQKTCNFFWIDEFGIVVRHYGLLARVQSEN